MDSPDFGEWMGQLKLDTNPFTLFLRDAPGPPFRAAGRVDSYSAGEGAPEKKRVLANRFGVVSGALNIPRQITSRCHEQATYRKTKPESINLRFGLILICNPSSLSRNFYVLAWECFGLR